MEADAEVNKKKVDQLNAEVKKGNDTIASLKKDIDGFKKEIQERDDTIQDKVKTNNNFYRVYCKKFASFLKKEKRIYDLKKKNQELEKFKFVLDYKIKEQKKMVEPRELEIKDLKEEKTKMESELERFNKQNTQLGLDVKEMHSRLTATQKELKNEQEIVQKKIFLNYFYLIFLYFKETRCSSCS
jgi:cilia- and flagella-associated protein 57